MPGMGELIVILLIVLVVFGANKLPGIGDALGRSIKNFKKASNVDDDDDDDAKRAPPRSRSPAARPVADRGRWRRRRVGRGRRASSKKEVRELRRRKKKEAAEG